MGLIAFGLTCLLAAGILELYVKILQLVWDWASIRVWYLSYPLDAWIERALDVPDERRRFG